MHRLPHEASSPPANPGTILRITNQVHSKLFRDAVADGARPSVRVLLDALRAHGFNVRRFEDGFPERKAAGLPIEAAGFPRHARASLLFHQLRRGSRISAPRGGSVCVLSVPAIPAILDPCPKLDVSEPGRAAPTARPDSDPRTGMEPRSMAVPLSANPIPVGQSKARAILSRTVTVLWWICTIIAVGWACLVATAVSHDLAVHDTADLWPMAAAGVLPLFILIGARWIFTGRWRFGPRGA